MMADGMPKGYRFLPDPDEIAAAVLKRPTWAVLALILAIELFIVQGALRVHEALLSTAARFKSRFSLVGGG